jgi:uncharacterized protein
MRALLRSFVAAVVVASAGALAAEIPAPTLAAHVTDLTGTLAAADIARLEQRLAALEQRKGAQVAVLMVPTTGDEPIESFALRVAEKNRLGREKPDDGLLLVVAKDDRRARIEVGYGLEGAVPDATASRVIREYLAPPFREGDFAGGIDAALAVLEKLVEGEPLPAPMAAHDDGSSGPGWPFAIIIGLFVGVFAAGTRISPVLLRRLGAGGVAAGIATLLLGFGMALGVAAIVAFLVAGSRAHAGGRYIGHGPVIGGGGFGGGGWGGSSGGGGGGWSGGGGGFGGGGASGGW